MRFGVTVDCDEVFVAWTVGDLDAKRRALSIPTNGVERHHLLQSLVEQLFQGRKSNPAYIDELMEIAELHMQELPFLLSELERHYRLTRAAVGSPPGAFVRPGITTLKHLSDIHIEAGRLNLAVGVWRREHAIGAIDDDRLDEIISNVTDQHRRQSQPRVSVRQKRR